MASEPIDARPSRTPETEAVLLDAARAELLAHGVRRTTASDIARRAGVSRQTLYRYWPDAHAVFAALVTREVLAALPAAAEDPDDLDALVALLVGTADGSERCRCSIGCARPIRSCSAATS